MIILAHNHSALRRLEAGYEYFFPEPNLVFISCTALDHLSVKAYTMPSLDNLEFRCSIKMLSLDEESINLLEVYPK